MTKNTLSTTDPLPTSTTAPAMQIDISLCASLCGHFPPACLSSTFWVAIRLVSTFATFGSSSPMAQLRPSSAHHCTWPRLTSAYLRPSLFASTWHKLASAHHSTARLAPSRFTSPRPSLASVHLASTTQTLTFTLIATNVLLYRTCMHLSPATRLLFSCTNHDFGPS